MGQSRLSDIRRSGGQFAAAALALVLLMLVFPGSAQADPKNGGDQGTGGAVWPVDGQCRVGKAGVQMVIAPTGNCVDPTPPAEEQLKITTVKEQGAALLQDVRAGKPGAEAAYDEATADVLKLTGETAVHPPSSSASAGGPSPEYVNLGWRS